VDLLTRPGALAVQELSAGRTLTAPGDQGATISTLGWIIVVAAAWLAVATVVGVLVGRVVRLRDRQVPPAPASHSETEGDAPRRVPGRGRRHS
jgi:hypothetical protein